MANDSDPFDAIIQNARGRRRIGLQTRCGNDIENYIEPASNAKQQNDASLEDQHPDYDFRRYLDQTSAYNYNCAGMIWASRRASVSMTWKNIRLIRDDDGYRQILKHEVKVDDLVLYMTQTESEPTVLHVARIVRVTKGAGNMRGIRVLSKWGESSGEFFHDLDDIPNIVENATKLFWTDRPPQQKKKRGLLWSK